MYMFVYVKLCLYRTLKNVTRMYNNRHLPMSLYEQKSRIRICGSSSAPHHTRRELRDRSFYQESHIVMGNFRETFSILRVKENLVV